jgi:hypothetical protein
VAAVEDVAEIVFGEIDFAWEAGGFSNCYSTGHMSLAVIVAVVVVAMGSMQWGRSTGKSWGSWEGTVVDSREGNCIDLAYSLYYSIY